VTVRASWVRPPASHKDNNNKDQGRIFDNFTLSTRDHVRYAQSGQLQVTVTDTGAGLSEDQLGQLFADGVQFNVNLLQAGQGSGLGLYIAKGIVEQHRGTLVAASGGLRQGTAFTVTLPLYHVPDSALPRSLAHHQNHIPTKTDMVSTENGAMTTLRDGPLRILVVDDAVTNRKMLIRLLQRRGHDCDQAEDGHVAVQKVTEALKDGTPYDTILMDYEMPVMNGPTASKEIRALGCDAFIVGVTGNVLPEDIDHFRRCGANAVFPKPFHIGALEEIWVEFGVTGRA
jgi:CheY-like chemotaxis protein